MRKKSRVVGFYKKAGETRPITKSDEQLRQRKIIQKPTIFRGVRPKASQYTRALRLLEDPRTATIEAYRDNKMTFNKPATLIMRNHMQGLLVEGQVDKLTLKDVKGNVLFDSEVSNPKASKHWTVVANGIVSGDFRSKTPLMEYEALVIARDLYSRQLKVGRSEIQVWPD